MKTLIVYDSAFGNTGQIAFAMRDALRNSGELAVIRAIEVKPENLEYLDLLIVGSPTQKFRPLKSINDFLGSIPRNSLKNIKVAAFDTRIDLKKANSRFLNLLVYFFGYAAKPIASKLIARGGKLLVPPEGFFVEGTNGPLTAGEMERAAAWAGKMLT